MNKFVGIGRLTKDLELNQTSSGKVYIQNSIAIRNNFKNSKGEYDSEFVNIVVWNKTAEYLINYAQKGTLISVEGRLNTRYYDKKDGTRGNITEILCDSVEILERKKDVETTVTENVEEDPYAEFGEEINIEDNFLE